MGYTDALKKFDTSYEKNALYYDPNGGKTGNAVDFGKYIREKQSAGNAAADTQSGNAVIHSPFGTDAAVDMLSAMARMSDPYSFEELDFFGESESLDTSIGLDEIEELDEMADDLAAQAEIAAGNDIFGNTDLFDEQTEAGSDDDLAEFALPDELM